MWKLDVFEGWRTRMQVALILNCSRNCPWKNIRVFHNPHKVFQSFRKFLEEDTKRYHWKNQNSAQLNVFTTRWKTAHSSLSFFTNFNGDLAEDSKNLGSWKSRKYLSIVHESRNPIVNAEKACNVSWSKTKGDFDSLSNFNWVDYFWNFLKQPQKFNSARTLWEINWKKYSGDFCSLTDYDEEQLKSNRRNFRRVSSSDNHCSKLGSVNFSFVSVISAWVSE